MKSDILVLVLFSGEQEYHQMLTSLAAQDYVYYDIYVIEGKENKEAHDELYNKIMSASDSYNVFVKLDADMVIETRSFLTEIRNQFLTDDDLDMLSFTVFDKLTDKRIWGINSFSKRCIWKSSDDSIFVDHSPTFPGRHEKKIDLNDMVSHCKDPSDYQSFMFGFHRASKIIQRDRGYPFFGHMLIQLKTISAVREIFKKRNSRIQYYALVGVFYFYSQSKDSSCFNKNSLIDEFDRLTKPSRNQLLRKTSIREILKAVGLKRLVLSITYFVLYKLK